MIVQSDPDLVGGTVPELGDRLVALLLVDLAGVVLALDRGQLVLVAAEDLGLGRGRLDVVLGDRHTRLGGVVEADVLERVEHLRDRRRPVGLHEVVDQLGGVALLHRAVDELVGAGVELLAQRLLERPLDLVVVDDPADRGQQVTALPTDLPELGEIVQVEHAVLV